MSTQVTIALLLAAAGALAINVGEILQHRGANSVPDFEVRRPVRSTRLLLGSGWFALGWGLAQFAGLLHIAALALAPMSIVQVVLAAGVVVLAALAERVLGATVPRRQRIGLFAAAAGLVLLVVSLPKLHGAHSVFHLSTLVSFEALTALVGLIVALGPRRPRLLAHRGVLLGAAAGTFFGLSDIAVKAITGTLQHGTLTAGLPWLAVAAAGGIAAQILAVRGLQEGDAVPVIALMGLTANIANIAGGILVFGDPIGHGPVSAITQSVAFVLVILGAALLPAPTQAFKTRSPMPPAAPAA